MAVLGLCFVFMAVYTVYAILFAACTIIVAAQAGQAMWVSVSTATTGSISLSAIFAGGLCIWIPGIFHFCRHLLPGYIAIAAPMTVSVLVVAGEISIPPYTTLWAILIGGQSCMLVISCIGAELSGGCILLVIAAIIGTVPITGVTIVHAAILLIVAYRAIWGIALFVVSLYPAIVNKNYTKRWRKLKACCYPRDVSIYGHWRAVLAAITFIRPAVFVSGL